MIGTSLGHYRIISELGRGGMGIVYRAEDTKLERTVAIKVLPPNALTNEEDRARFYREAKAAAQLNHPHIAAIHQIDEAIPEGSAPGTGPSPFIAMEFIDGQPLDARIRERPLPLKEAVQIASDVASALQMAHEKQIVHRDIKSANVMLTSKGEPKVLDFGLAKTTHSTMLTRMGSTMGTVAYMSPEQARGEVVDSRTDLWSLGIMLYEMVAGRVPFATDYEQAAVYSILNEDPEPLTALRSGVPLELERIVHKLLAKDVRHRYQTAADLMADLGALDLSGSGAKTIRATGPFPSPAPSKSNAPRVAIMALAGILIMTVGWWIGGRTAAPASEAGFARFTSVLLPDMPVISHPAISPDGRYMSFTTNRSALWLYDFSDGSLKVLDSEGDIRVNTFSPDGRWLAYEARGSNIYLAQIPEGTTSLLVSASVLPEWIDNEWLLISDERETGLDRYNRITGEREIIYRPEGDNLHISHADVLPGGKAALVSILTSPRKIGLLDLKDGSLKQVADNAFAPRYLSSGHVMFTRQAGGVTSFEGDVFTQPYDAANQRLLGQPVRVMEARGFWEYGVNSQGDLITSVPLAGEVQTVQRDLYLVDAESGTRTDTGIDLPLSAQYLQLTRDEEWLMFIDKQNDELMFGKIADGRFAPVPNVTKPLFNAVLSDNDESVLYTQGQVGGGLKIHRQSLDGSSPPEPLDFELGRHEILMDVKGENELLVSSFASVGAQEYLYWVDTETGEKRLILEGNVDNARLSPDGKWIAWHHYADGGEQETWISGVHGEGPWLIARNLSWPDWRKDGQGLFMYDDTRTVYTDISTDRGPRAVGSMKEVMRFEGRAIYSLRSGADTFVLLDRPNNRTESVSSMDVVLGWSERLKELAPVN